MVESKKRDSYFDNVKVFLILMVVLGHFIEPFRWTNPVYNGVYSVIYSFHMPLFIFVSGYFSKNIMKSREHAFRDFLLVYILFNTIYQVTTGGEGLVNAFQPTFIYWYLLSMFLWKILLQDVVKIRWYGLVMLIVALYIGNFDNINRFMSLSRTFVFFPYFLLGYMTKESWIEKVKKIPKWITFPMTFMSMGIIAILFNRQILASGLLLGADSYKTLGLEVWDGIVSRLIIYLIAVVLGILILNLIPRKEMFMTSFGRRTMPIYLGHAYMVLWLEGFGVPTVNPYKGTLFFVGLACLTVFVLGNKWSYWLYEKAMECIKKIVVKSRESLEKSSY